MTTATKATATVTLPEYNGWTNYPTWNVMLWINNDEPTYRAWLDFAATHPDKHDARAYVLRFIKENNAISPDSGPASDIRGYGKHYGKSLYAMMQMIDFERIAECAAEEETA